MFNFSREVENLIADLNEVGTAFLVGGMVRDRFMNEIHDLGLESKDVDLEILGIDTFEELESIASRHGNTTFVNRSFPAVSVRLPNDEVIDLCLPRDEVSTGDGTGDFETVVTPDATPEEAASRRDFTINAITFNTQTGEFVDPFGGVEDIRNRVLRTVSDRFAEDPLRVLRGFSFAGRFDLEADESFIRCARNMTDKFSALPQKRIIAEWEKWATRSIRPSAGLRVLRQSEWLQFFPELEALIGVEQDPEWHPEGDVWNHTLECVDSAVAICERDEITGENRFRIVMGALVHDFGKVPTTILGDDNRWHAPRHDKAGVELAMAFGDRIFRDAIEKDNPDIVKFMADACEFHMCHVGWNGEVPRDGSLLRITDGLRVATFDDLARIIQADVSGRPFDELLSVPVVESARERICELLSNDANEPVVDGRMLINCFGLKPGREFGIIIRLARSAVLRDEFDLEQDSDALRAAGREWVRDNRERFERRGIWNA